MDPSYRASLSRHGAVVGGSAAVVSFGDAAHELDIALRSCGLVDRTDYGRVAAGGRDAAGLLHRLGTADLQALAPSEGRPTVLTTAKGRIVERLFVHHLGEGGLFLVGGPASAARVIAHVERYTFREDTRLRDATSSLGHLSLLGPRARDAAGVAGLPVPPPFCSEESSMGGVAVHVLAEDGLSGEGISVVVPIDSTAPVWESLVRAAREVGGGPVGSEAAEAWRVLRGLPASGHELTEEHNPLEAGLRAAVSFTKGCYVGQEVIARLNTYGKVARRLIGLVLPEGADAPPRGTALFAGGRREGEVTSALVPPGRRSPVALAYAKLDAATVDLAIGSSDSGMCGRIVDLPFGDTP